MKSKSLIFTLFIFVIAFLGCSQEENNSIKIYLGWVPCQDYAFLYWAKSEGYFKDVGIENVEIIPTRGTSEVANALTTGTADFGFLGAETVVLAYEKGQYFKAVGVLYKNTPTTIMYHNENNDINNINDLAGKKVGVILQSATYPLYKAILEKNNVNTNDIAEVIAVRGGLTQFINGDIDALIHYTNHGPIAMRYQGIKIDEFLVKDHGISIYGLVLAMNDELMSGLKKELARKFIFALKKAIIDAADKKEEVQKAFLKEFPQNDESLFALQLDRTYEILYENQSPLEMTMDGWKKSLNTLMNTKQLTTKLDSNDINKFIDMDYISK